ncbi:hypothetical protein LQ564_12180 [Massilia sp. G4R7]|uniref:Lipoprotein n=1 Tax=Massilia phyllostachyos TaxID=2898585 RepID=A0ABS8Q5N4_9BURK|nr:hypothetical protein [Massilia phyllostachyos]MCD2517063.1 hypothetical protein [Massilia phyllostachyos]
MDPLTYSLCQKPVIALAMFVAGACAFPPLFQDEPFALQQADAPMRKEFDAPVGKPYSLNLHFRFPTAAASLADFALAKGSYVLELRSLESQLGLDGVETTVSLVSGDRK